MKFRSMLMCAGAIFTIAACHDSSVSVDKVNVNVAEPLSPERTDSVKEVRCRQMDCRLCRRIPQHLHGPAQGQCGE